MGKERHGLLAHQKGRKGKRIFNAKIAAMVAERLCFAYRERFDVPSEQLGPDDFRAVRRF